MNYGVLRIWVENEVHEEMEKLELKKEGTIEISDKNTNHWGEYNL